MPRDQLGKAEQQRHDDAGNTDDFEAADRGGAGVEHLGEGKPGNADRYRADRDPEGELEVNDEPLRRPAAWWQRSSFPSPLSPGVRFFSRLAR